MNKSELVQEIANLSDLTQIQAEAALNGLVDAITQTLGNKEKVTLLGFGSFETIERSARIGRNPKTGKTIEIAASITPKFRAGKTLKDAVRQTKEVQK